MRRTWHFILVLLHKVREGNRLDVTSIIFFTDVLNKITHTTDRCLSLLVLLDARRIVVPCLNLFISFLRIEDLIAFHHDDIVILRDLTPKNCFYIFGKIYFFLYLKPAFLADACSSLGNFPERRSQALFGLDLFYQFSDKLLNHGNLGVFYDWVWLLINWEERMKHFCHWVKSTCIQLCNMFLILVLAEASEHYWEQQLLVLLCLILTFRGKTLIIGDCPT